MKLELHKHIWNDTYKMTDNNNNNNTILDE